MPHDWENAAEVRRWDQHATDANPIRPEQLDVLVAVLAGFWQPGRWAVDLGCGSGQVEKAIFDRIPAACVVGVDGSTEMMKLARERLATQLARFEAVRHDLAELSTLPLPAHPYQFVIAVQSLHHLSERDMRGAYAWAHGLLEPGGLFLLQDRLRVETSGVWRVMRAVWERQDREHGSAVADREGASFVDHERIVRERGDYPVLLDQHLSWLREAGFEAVCLHLHGNRALIAGYKPV